MAIEIVDFPIKNGGSFHSYVKLPEGNYKSPSWTVFKSQEFYRDAIDFFFSDSLRCIGENVHIDCMGI